MTHVKYHIRKIVYIMVMSFNDVDYGGGDDNGDVDSEGGDDVDCDGNYKQLPLTHAP